MFEAYPEDVVNPPDLTASERDLQKKEKLNVFKKVSWDAKQVLDRVRVNKKFEGKTYAEVRPLSRTTLIPLSFSARTSALMPYTPLSIFRH